MDQKVLEDVKVVDMNEKLLQKEEVVEEVVVVKINEELLSC